MGIRRGSISTPIIADGLVFNMDAANRASYIPNTTTVYNTTNTILSGSFQNDVEFVGPPTASFSFGVDGVDDSIVFTETGDSIIDAPKTLSFWYYTDNGSQVGELISRTSNDYEVYQHTNGNALWTYWGGATCSYKIAVVTGAWTHITYTIDDSTSPYSTQNIYENGVLDDSTQFGANPSYNNSSPLTLGVRASSTNYYWDGKFANIQMYNRALSANEVLHNYNALKGRFI